MSSHERRAVRERLSTYMEYHPLTQESAQVPHVPTQASTSMFHTISVRLSNMPARPVAGVCAVLVLIIVPLFAERALPGDVLYPVKVRVNEGVKSTLVRSPYEQVAWETERLERRLAEARLLAAEGKLTPEVESEVAEAVKQHSDAAQAGIDSIRKSDSDEAAIAEIELSSALEVQSEMLQGQSERLSDAVDEARTAAADSQGELPPSYEKLLARIERESTYAYELLDSVLPTAESEERADIEMRLSVISERVGAAQSAHEAGNTDEAVATLAKALGDIRKVVSFITDIEVRAIVSLDRLIPEDITSETRRTLIEERIAEIETLLAATGTPAYTTDVAESARTRTENATAALTEGDLNTADTESLAAYELLTTPQSPTTTPATATSTESDTADGESESETTATSTDTAPLTNE